MFLRKVYFVIAGITILIFITPFVAAGEGWRAQFPAMKLVGDGVLSIFFVDIYKLSLYSKSGRYMENDDFVLEFEYLRPVSKKEIVAASISELSKFGDATPHEKKQWQKILNGGIVDMKAGEKAAVIFSKTGNITFDSPGEHLVSYNAPKFLKKFASIWLGDTTKYPQLRQQLLDN